MCRRLLILTIALAPIASGLSAQSPATDLIQQARARLGTSELDSADVLLAAALSNATERTDSVSAYTWRAILSFMRGDEAGTRAAFNQALQLNPKLQVQGLAQASPRLAELFDQEHDALKPDFVYTTNNVDEKPRRVSGPPVVYPPDLLRRQVRGRALVGLIVDTLGRAEANSIDVIATPDSGLNAPLREMLLASTFAPGRQHGKAVRTMMELAIELEPGTPPSATSLITSARAKIAQRQADSAMALLAEALEPATKATEGERVYAQLVQGLAWKTAGRDTLSRAAFDSGLAGYRRLTERGVELAPFLKHLADSVRLTLAGKAAGALGTPAVVEAVDAAPVPVSQLAIQYPPEMQALHIGGTVIVEARVDATGHVLQGTVRVVTSPNPGLEQEAKRVAAAAVYRPARRGGHAVAVTIRQPITFVPY